MSLAKFHNSSCTFKKVGKLEKREKGLIEQMAVHKERENDAEKKEIQYEQLLERYKGQSR